MLGDKPFIHLDSIEGHSKGMFSKKRRGVKLTAAHLSAEFIALALEALTEGVLKALSENGADRQDIIAASENMRMAIVRGAHTFSKEKTGKKDPADLEDIIREIANHDVDEEESDFEVIKLDASEDNGEKIGQLIDLLEGLSKKTKKKKK